MRGDLPQTNHQRNRKSLLLGPGQVRWRCNTVVESTLLGKD